jgi:hypothetical protein
MTLTSAEPQPQPASPVAAEAEPAAPDRRLRGWHADLLVAAGYLLGACCVMVNLLGHPVLRTVRWGATGQVFSEWMLRHGAGFVSGGQPLLHATRPDGTGWIDVLGGHGFPGLSVVLAPLTLLIGPARTFAVAVPLCLAGTAYAWYHVLSRHVVRNRSVAVLAGALGGFAPAMIAHAQGDLGRVAQFLIPFLIWQAVRLREPGRAVRGGLAVGLLAAGQAVIDEEMLLLVGLGGAVFLVAHAVGAWPAARRQAPAFLRGAAVAVPVTAVLLAFPIWRQYTGPHAHRADPAGMDLFSYVAFGTQSLATWPLGQLHHARQVTEQHTFYGWPLLILLVAGLWWARGPARTVAATAGVLAVLALGADVTLNDAPLGVVGPWRWLGQLPLLRTVPALDLALAVLPLVVLLFALVADRGSDLVRAAADRFATIAWYGVLAAVLVPLVPVPVEVVDRYGPAWRTAVAIARASGVTT